jgi:hypothetical protein
VVALAGSATPLLAAPERVERWTPVGVSSELFESHPAFDPLTGSLYFVRSSKKFSGWRILTAHCQAAYSVRAGNQRKYYGDRRAVLTERSFSDVCSRYGRAVVGRVLYLADRGP